jgi:hypothetical protein
LKKASKKSKNQNDGGQRAGGSGELQPVALFRKGDDVRTEASSQMRLIPLSSGFARGEKMHSHVYAPNRLFSGYSAIFSTLSLFPFSGPRRNFFRGIFPHHLHDNSWRCPVREFAQV